MEISKAYLEESNEQGIRTMTREKVGKGDWGESWKCLKLQVNKFRYLVTMRYQTESYQTQKWDEQSNSLGRLIWL